MYNPQIIYLKLLNGFALRLNDFSVLLKLPVFLWNLRIYSELPRFNFLSFIEQSGVQLAGS